MKINWQTKKLGEVCDILDNKRKPITKRDRTAGEYPYYGATGILDYVKNYIFDEKLVLIGEDGAKWESGEHTAFIAGGKYWVNNHAHVIRPHRDTILDNWITYFFYLTDLTEHTTGLTVPKLNQTSLRCIEIPLPPLTEQKRIVKILDEVFGGIEKAKENAEKNLQNAKELFESYLQSVFASDVEQKKLGDKSLLQIIDGDRGKNYPKKSDFHDEGYCLFLNTKNVRPDGFSFETKMFITEAKDNLLGNGKLKRDDVLLTTRGTIGNIAVYDENVPFENIRINSGMLIFRPDTKVIIPEYLFAVFQSGIMKSQIKKYVSGAAQPQLPIKTLVDFSIPVPKSLANQKAIVKKLDVLSGETKKLEVIFLRKITDLDELKKSVLKKAFSGEL